MTVYVNVADAGKSPKTKKQTMIKKAEYFPLVLNGERTLVKNDLQEHFADILCQTAK